MLASLAVCDTVPKHFTVVFSHHMPRNSTNIAFLRGVRGRDKG